MPFLGVKEAAAAIRDKIRLSHMEPHDVHQLVFLKSVADELGLGHEPEVITHIAGLLREHDIQIHSGHEYPKWIGKGTAAVVVNDEEEEKAYRAKFEVNDEPDEPVAPSPTKDGHFDRSLLDDEPRPAKAAWIHDKPVEEDVHDEHHDRAVANDSAKTDGEAAGDNMSGGLPIHGGGSDELVG
jgi:hypothetical protein